jgi:hypothetical protein
MDYQIYGIRRRGIFDAVRIPKGWTGASEARNDLLTDYNNGKNTALPPQLYQPPTQPIFGNPDGGTIDFFEGFFGVGAPGAGLISLAGVFNSGSIPIIVDRIMVSANNSSDVNLRFGDFLDLDGEVLGGVRNKTTGLLTRLDASKRLGILRLRQGTAVDPGRIFKSLYILSRSPVELYLNRGQDELRIPPGTGMYVDANGAAGAGNAAFFCVFEWREQNFPINQPYFAPSVQIVA